MGSPISGLVAEAVMQRLERIYLPLQQPKLWVRYVDDSFVIIKRTDLDDTHRMLNVTFNGSRFTEEVEENQCPPFLDVLVTRKDTGDLETKVYRKNTHTDQVLSSAIAGPKPG